MKRAFALILILASLGCSNQWREGEPERSPEEVASMLSELQNVQGSGTGGVTGDMSAALQYQQDAIIYFADAPSKMAQVANLVSFPSFQWLTGQDVSWEYYSEARVFFLDHSNGQGGSDVGLIIGLNDGNGYSYYAFSGTGSVVDGIWEAQLTGGSGSIVLRSYDFADGVLNDVIQLRVFTDDGTGNLTSVGKISTLIGYE